jgi:hypothetical protein
MAIAPPLQSPTETTQASGPPEMLIPEAHRRRRRRWMVGIAVVVLCVSGVGLGAAVLASGSGGDKGSGLPPSAPDPLPITLGTPPVSGVDLAGGRWTTLPPPNLGVEKVWNLAAWTGTYVIAWGSVEPCCGSLPGEPTGGSSVHGAAFNPGSNIWRSLPPAPIDVNVESTIWTGSQVIVWGSTPAAAQQATQNVLLEFEPKAWRWKRLATPPMSPRSAADVLWSGTSLIVIGGHDQSTPALLNGETYDPQSNRWSELPIFPNVTAVPGSSAEPVGVTAAWAVNSLYVWVTRQVSQACGIGCGEISRQTQALRWHPGSQWYSGPTLPRNVSAYNATAVSMGWSIAILNGSSCLPEMSCPPRGSGTPALFDVRTGRWSSIGVNAVLKSAGAFVWTGQSLVALSPFSTPSGYLVGGYAAALDPANDSWVNLPVLPVSAAPPSGPVVSGTVWTGSRLIEAGLEFVPQHGTSSTRAGTAGTLPSCPPISFPELVGGQFCGPAPGPGNGSGSGGSCIGTETTPPCGPGMVGGRYYAYTLNSLCTSDYIDGRWWTNELPGGSGLLNVWVSVGNSLAGAGWIGPNGSVGFKPSTATSCD